MNKVKHWSHEENLTAIHPLLADIVYNRQAYLPDGNRYPLGVEISRAEMFFIYSHILGMEHCQDVLEIGCAMGISSLVIEAALKARGNTISHHLIIDPFQNSQWKNIGVEHLRLAGFSNYELLPLKSEIALPDIMQREDRYDFIFQDGMHTLDHCLLEFHYLDRILKIGGLLIYDDIDNISMNRFIRYISLYPHWEIVSCAGKPSWPRSRYLLNLFRRSLSPFLKVIPRRIAIELLSDTILRPDEHLGLNSSMIALRKIGNDERPDAYRSII